ncbi:hypothetical protein Ahy_B07g086608 [Arachis hypogaea]|uniref:No apical meristem-associated C-terminal domain-containing protein n=1 Tax=Arachis hypogaea TaxID=3818 RepID=A0A444YA17_ARAHY|nr:hypothetical protein Ahy_B07g086608 [Arachis hypogaea]
MPDDYTIWNKIIENEKKKAAFDLDCSETSKDDLNIEQKLHMWKEKVNEQKMINKEQKLKLDDAEQKLKDQRRQLKS